jgi:hypothetical protein
LWPGGGCMSGSPQNCRQQPVYKIGDSKLEKQA